MAKIGQGFMGGFSGRLGPAVGYQWNGKWCLRSRPVMIKNPRTAAQQEHRTLFREEVRLAARMSRAINRTLTEAARAAGMTSYNLFVSINQHCFSLVDGQLAVDYASLVLSMGPVAPVRFGTPQVEEGITLTVPFERNPEHTRAGGLDMVSLYVYCPAIGKGYLAAPVYRKAQSISVVLSDDFAGQEWHLYGFVADEHGLFSETIYGGTVNGANPVGSAPVVDMETGEILSLAATVPAETTGQQAAIGANAPRDDG
ncbi:MAG: DUF6266 family protein [Bacteroidales bacterium]|nr:DUF6266 family protein [Bacteroidales bacterium]